MAVCGHLPERSAGTLQQPRVGVCLLVSRTAYMVDSQQSLRWLMAILFGQTLGAVLGG